MSVDPDTDESESDCESPPPADEDLKEKNVKEILKENGYNILNNNAYSREMKPHCHVVFDLERNVIEKAFFTFEPLSQYKNFNLYKDGEVLNKAHKRAKKLPEEFMALQ